jgi:LytS/YehU family sensor histidine kinase
MVATYVLNNFLTPDYLMRERYGLFLLYFLYVLVGAVFLEMLVAMVTFMIMTEVRISDMSPASVDIVFLMTSLLLVVFFAFGIKMLLRWRQSKEDYQKLMRDKVEGELKFLKMQMNPHFLFNTLNNLYYLTSEKSDKAPQAILQLSEMLDYVMHATKADLIPLEKELKQVENFIALEMLRYEGRVNITKEIQGVHDGSMVPPMTLITLIENAFKHGVMNNVGISWISLKVKSSPELLEIQVRNSWQRNRPGQGIGLRNLESQLAYLYPGRYALQVDDHVPGEYSVKLNVRP